MIKQGVWFGSRSVIARLMALSLLMGMLGVPWLFPSAVLAAGAVSYPVQVLI